MGGTLLDFYLILFGTNCTPVMDVTRQILLTDDYSPTFSQSSCGATVTRNDITLGKTCLFPAMLADFMDFFFS